MWRRQQQLSSPLESGADTPALTPAICMMMADDDTGGTRGNNFMMHA